MIGRGWKACLMVHTSATHSIWSSYLFWCFQRCSAKHEETWGCWSSCQVRPGRKDRGLSLAWGVSLEAQLTSLYRKHLWLGPPFGRLFFVTSPARILLQRRQGFSSLALWSVKRMWEVLFLLILEIVCIFSLQLFKFTNIIWHQMFGKLAVFHLSRMSFNAASEEHWRPRRLIWMDMLDESFPFSF